MAGFTNTFEFKIIEHISKVSENKNGWTLELNLVSFNGEPANYDIRRWDKSHTRMSKGITMSKDELKNLYLSIEEYIEG